MFTVRHAFDLNIVCECTSFLNARAVALALAHYWPAAHLQVWLRDEVKFDTRNGITEA